MNTIQQISLKIQLGLDPAAEIEPELLLEQWQQITQKRSQARSLRRAGGKSLAKFRATKPASMSL